MNRIIFIIFALAFWLNGFAQKTINERNKSICFTVPKPSQARVFDGSQNPGMQFNMPEPMVKENRSFDEFQEFQTMTTYYDLQSNSALGNRIAVWPDGTASIVSTWDNSGSTSFPDRGTGYNYYNGYSFGNWPEVRQEPMKSGWSSIAACGNGEVLASHATGVNVYYRPTKGQGEWTLLKNWGTDYGSPTWPRVVVSGPNDQYIHIVMCKQISLPDGGYDNHIYYSRSTDRGQTWSTMIDFPGVDNTANGLYRNQLSADDYVMAANGNNVAVMFSAYTTEVFYMISHDNGQTWSKQVVAPFPIQGVHAIDFDDYPNGMTDSISTSDNSHSIAIDNNGVVHVAFGLFHWKVADSDSYTYWPVYGYGIVYWNSNYTNQQGGHEIPLFGNFSGDANHPEWFANGKGYTLMPDRIMELAETGGNQANLRVLGLIDEDGDGYYGGYENTTGAYWHYRTLGCATLPGVSVDNMGNVAIIYNVWSEVRICSSTGFSYRSAYVTYRDQYGNWFDDAINLSADFIHSYDEVYSTFASPKGYNGTFWMGYSADEAQGLYLDISDTYPSSNGGMMTENYIWAVKVSPFGNTNNYTITAAASPSNAGTITGAGTYAQGSTCTLHANANSGYTFVNWIENGHLVSTNPNYSFTVTGNRNLIAVFDVATTNYTVTSTAYPTNGGTVTGGGTYTQGSTCTLHATPNNGYSFVKWEVNGTVASYNPIYSFTVWNNTVCVAFFEPTVNNYTITATANPSNGGTVSGAGTYAQGSTCTLTATANNGYHFEKWTKNGTQISTSPSYSFTVTENASYVAQFAEDVNEFTITASADPANGGTVSGAGIYPEGATCVLSAMPNNDFVFDRWSINGFVVSTQPSLSFVVSRNVNYVAHFIQDANHVTITAMADPVEGGAVTGSGTYELGATCTINAIAAVGYEFVKWTLNGSQVSTNTTFSFQVTSNAVYVAHFTPVVNHYTVAVNVEPSTAGTIVGAGTYEEGATCTLIAMPNPTYSFVSWTENGVVIATDDRYTFTVDRNRNFVAVFSQGLFYTITASASTGGTITPVGNVIVEPEENKTFSMIPDNGYSIVKVIVDGVDIGPVESYTFRNVNANHSIHVQFSGVGVDEAYALGLKVYPNPAKDYVLVEGKEIREILIYDLLGMQLRREEVVDADQARIGTENLVSGAYIMKVVCKDGRSGYLRFVVAR